MVRETGKHLDWASRIRIRGWPYVIFGAVFAAIPSLGQAAWLTGESFARQLELPVEIHWQDAVLRESLQRLATAHGVAIVLDRRIDPGQRVTTSFVQSKLIDALSSFSDTHGWGVSVVSPVVYIGPREATRPLATWHRQQQTRINQLSPVQQRRWHHRSPCDWAEASEPRSLMAEWLRQAGIVGSGLEQVPHDLWPAQQLPPLDLLERLVVALAGFQLAPHVNDDGSVTIVPLPVDVKLSQRYAVPPRRRRMIEQLRAELPDSTLTLDGSTVLVEGRAEDHDHVQRWLAGTSRRPPSGGSLANKRFTLSVENQPVDAVLQAVARQLGLELVWQAGTESWRDERVSLKVENATLKELITSVLQGHPAAYRIRGQRLVIAPVDAPER